MKNKLIIILMLIFGVSLNAAEHTWANAFPIYTYGDVSSIAAVYEFIHSIVSDPLPRTVFAIGFTFTAIFAGWRARDGEYDEILKAILAPITLYALFFAPTVNVHIVDLRVDKNLISYSTPDGGYKKVEEVPLAIAFVPASSSLLVSVFIDFIDENWNSVSVGNRFSTLGFQGMSEISQQALVLSQLKDLNSSLSGDVYNMSRYVNKCLVIEGLKTPTNHHKLVKPSKVFPEMFDPTNFDGNIGVLNTSFTKADGTDTGVRTCSQLYATYVSGISADIESGLADVLKGHFPNVNINSATFNEAWRENSGVQQAVVGNIQEAMATTAASRALARDLETEGIGVNGVSMATEIEIERTIANLRTEGLAKYEWTARMLPHAVNKLLMLMLGVFPLMIMVMSFVGYNAAKGVANFFMGYVAMNFNLVSLALVSNIISFDTAQNAQQAIVSYAGMPFGSTQLSDFMFQQADMAGLAGLIGAVSVPFITAAIFYGETKGLAAGMSAVSGSFRGNVGAGAKEGLVERDTQAELDKQLLSDAQDEKDASAWLTQEGFMKPSNMGSVEAKNQIMKNLSSIGNANAGADIFHAGNSQNFLKGSQAQSSQGFNKTAGFGGSVDMASAGSVAFEDGEVMGSMINNTARLRSNSDSYNPSDVGKGQAIGMFGKDMGSIALANLDSNANASVANATNAVANQVGAGQGLLKTGAFNSDGTLADNKKSEALIEGAALSAAQKTSEQIGVGTKGNMQDFLDKGFMDGSRGANATNRASEIMKDGVDKNGDALYDEDRAALGQAMQEVAGHNKNMQTADAANFGRTGEVDGVGDFISGMGAQSRIAANDAIGVGEKWQSMDENEKIADMAKVKENSARKTFGGIRGANAELHADGRSVDDAIKDDVTLGTEKGLGSATHADNLRGKYGSDLNGTNDKGMTLSETMSAIDQSKLDSQEGQGAGVLANKGINPEMYSDNAMYGEMSKQQSTDSKLTAQGGIGGAVGIDATEASIKAGTQMGSVEQSSKILEDAIKSGAADGAKTLSDAAAKVAEVQTGSQMGTTAGLMKKFSDPEALKKTLEDSGYKEAAKELEGMSAGDMAAWVASKQAGHMTGMHGLALRNDKGEMTSVGVSLGDDGARAMTVDSSFKKDDSKMNITGDGTNNVSGYNISPTGLLQEAMTTAGMDGHSAEIMSEIVKDAGVVMAADQFLSGGKGRKAAFSAAMNGWHKMRGHEKGVNANGKTQWGKANDFKEDGWVKNEKGSWEHPDNQRMERGSAGDDLKKATTTNPMNNATGVNINANTGVDMKNSSSLNSTDSISKNHDQTKLSQPGVVTPAPNVVGEARPSLGDPLKAPGTINPSGTVLDNQGFFEKRMSAVGDAMKHTKGGFLKTAGLVASAAVLGQANETFANTMSAADPVSYLMGSDTSKMADIGYAMANGGTGYKPNQNQSSFVNQNDIKPFNQPPSSIPQHAQQAFSQSSSSGFNTNAAGQEIYMANKADNLYTRNTDKQVVQQLEDINMGTEFNQEASEGVRDAVEMLMEVDRNRTEE